VSAWSWGEGQLELQTGPGERLELELQTGPGKRLELGLVRETRAADRTW